MEDLYARYSEDPASVDAEWRAFFACLKDDDRDRRRERPRRLLEAKPNWPIPANGELVSALDGNWAAVETAVGDKIKAKAGAKGAEVGSAEVDAGDARFGARHHDDPRLPDARPSPRQSRSARSRAARATPRSCIPPTTASRRPTATARSSSTTCSASNSRPIREIVAILERTYCQTIGVEFMHISDPAEKAWIQERIEGPDKEITFTREGKRAILNKLIEADGFEKFLDLKYTGTKRFGLDGGESMIPALEQIIKRGGALGVKEIVLGMAHRGRLNVLAQVMGKPHRAIFHEFKGGSFTPDDVEGSGDVKYHLGASSDRAFDGNNVHLSLTANPSHLEIVDPVVLGKARAKQDQLGDPPERRTSAMPLLLHGDAAFAGPGRGRRMPRPVGPARGIAPAARCISSSTTRSASPRARSSRARRPIRRTWPRWSRRRSSTSTATTRRRSCSPPRWRPSTGSGSTSRSSSTCSATAASATTRATSRPSRSRRCTKLVRQHPSTLEIYSKKLVAEGVVSEAEVEGMRSAFRTKLDSEFEIAHGYKPNKADWLDGRWAGLKAARTDEDDARRGRTGVPAETLKEIGLTISQIPPGFQVHRTIQRFIDNRRKMIETGEGIDWAMGEALAFGSLLLDGHPVRLSGQDVERGTFSQRHSVLLDQETEERLTLLNNIRDGQSRFEVINSMLSEEAVLGFEYGFSLSEPNALVLWEAQFGDFANGAQVVFDQFISSGERKWLRMSALICLLPHGYEGQGPEHSSARLERCLQMCAEDNMQVAYCSTPANYFHILRRQLKREFRKPLILMTPEIAAAPQALRVAARRACR